MQCAVSDAKKGKEAGVEVVVILWKKEGSKEEKKKMNESPQEGGTGGESCLWVARERKRIR